MTFSLHCQFSAHIHTGVTIGLENGTVDFPEDGGMVKLCASHSESTVLEKEVEVSVLLVQITAVASKCA